MSAFTVRVRTTTTDVTYSALGTDSATVIMDAIDQFGVCAVTATPA
ncbi:MAG: hypothetical protein V4684_19425 [Pseudomonadota bacterium]